MSLLMKMTQRLSLLLLLATAACGGSPATTNPLDPTLQVSPPVSQSTDNLPANAVGVKLVAKVNNQEITLPAFERELARRQQADNAASLSALRADVLDQLIQQVLTEQGAKAQNLVITDEQVQSELKNDIELAGGQDKWEQWLATNLYTPDEYTEAVRSTLIYNQVRDSLTADLEGNIRQVHARHILVRTEDEAKTALARLNAGEGFAAVAAELSQDETTRQQGGDLGWFTQEELLVPELAQAAFGLQPNQIGGPVATELGYHIIQTLEFADRPVDPDRRVYIAQARFENWLRPLYEKAVIERYIVNG